VLHQVLNESSSTLDLEYGTGVPGHGAVRVRVSQCTDTRLPAIPTVLYRVAALACSLALVAQEPLPVCHGGDVQVVLFSLSIDW
jgi:hypothetical protein